MTKTLTEEQQKLMDAALDRFDAEKCADLMHFMDWRWFDTEGDYPEPYEIRDKARKLCKWCFETGHGQASVATGGLEVELESGYLTISFVALRSEFDSEWLDGSPPF